MNVSLRAYKSLVFDCDGVILDSNKLKTQAFYQAALPFGETAAQALVDYHVQNGGVSRYRKFEYFLSSILGVSVNSEELENLLTTYANIVREGLLTCEIAPDLRELRQVLSHTRWLVVSGSDQTELRYIFEQRGLSKLFDGGIFGSPDNKIDILERETSSSNIRMPALFLGDSEYDHQAAVHSGLDFLFISKWTEFQNWQAYCSKNQIQFINDICELKKTSE